MEAADVVAGDDAHQLGAQDSAPPAASKQAKSAA
jgi:hypothetical protein